MELTLEELGDFDHTPLWLRRLSWDALPCEVVEEVQAKLGLVPAGDPEQTDQDHIASHKRIALVEALSPAVDYLSPLLSQVLTEAIIMQMGEAVVGAITDELKEKLTGQNAEIIRSGTLTLVAQMIATGVLEYTDKVNGS